MLRPRPPRFSSLPKLGYNQPLMNSAPRRRSPGPGGERPRRAWTVALALALLLGPGRGAWAEEGAPRRLTLDEALELARERNWDRRIRQTDVAGAEAAVRSAWSAYKPRVSWQGSFVHYDEANEYVDASGNTYVIQAQNSLAMSGVLSQPIVNARAVPTIKNAYEALRHTCQQNEVADGLLRWSVSRAFYNAALADQELEVAREAAQSSAERLKLAEGRFGGGLTNRATLLRARIDGEKYVKLAEQAAVRAAQARVTLGLLIGLQGPFEVVPPALDPASGGQLTGESAVERLTRQALDGRIDLQNARLALEMARRAKLATWLGFVPTLGFSFVVSGTESPGFDDDPASWYLGLTLDVPLYDAGARYARLKQDEAKIRAARLALGKLKAVIAAELRLATLEIRGQRRQLASARRQRQNARQNHDEQQKLFASGLASGLEMADAQQILVEARAAEVRAAYALALERLRLELLRRFPVGALSGSSTTTSSSTTSSAGSTGSSNNAL